MIKIFNCSNYRKDKEITQNSYKKSLKLQAYGVKTIRKYKKKCICKHPYCHMKEYKYI